MDLQSLQHRIKEMDLQEILILSVIGLLSWIVYQKYRLYSKMAPGPYGLPIVGSLIHLNKNSCYEEFQKYKEKYGKVFSVSAGNHLITVVTDTRLILDNMKKDEFSGRPDFELWAARNLGKRNRGILFSDLGPVWHEQRRFVIRSIRDFGFGKESIEGIILHELQELQKSLGRDVGHPVSLVTAFNMSVLNCLWTIVAGHRFELTDPKLKTLIKLMIEYIQHWKILTPVLFFPAPVKLGLVGRSTLKSDIEYQASVRRELFEVIDSHMSTYKEGEIRDFVDAYIQQIKDSPGNSSFYAEEGKYNLYAVLLDLFGAGAETVSTALQWAMLYLCHHQDVQKKAQAEIDSVVGRSRPPNRADRPNLVYLEATLNEMHRIVTMARGSLYHKAIEDAEIGGYFVPKDSIVMFSLYNAHHDPEVWGDPENFRPERFIDKSGTKFIKHEALIPFSSGKRQCIGEPLARDIQFLFMAGLLQQFSFDIDPDCSNKDFKRSPGLLSFPSPFKVIIKERS